MTLQRGLAVDLLLTSPPPSVSLQPLYCALRYTYSVYMCIHVCELSLVNMYSAYSVFIMCSMRMYMLDLSVYTIIRSGAYIDIGFS